MVDLAKALVTAVRGTVLLAFFQALLGVVARSVIGSRHGGVPVGVRRLVSRGKRGCAYVAGFLAFVEHVSWVHITFADASQVWTACIFVVTCGQNCRRSKCGS